MIDRKMACHAYPVAAVFYGCASRTLCFFCEIFYGQAEIHAAVQILRSGTKSNATRAAECVSGGVGRIVRISDVSPPMLNPSTVVLMTVIKIHPHSQGCEAFPVKRIFQCLYGDRTW